MAADGGPAFPCERMEQIEVLPNNPAFAKGTFPGMSLRDYFAAKAMQGLIADTRVQDTEAAIAEGAYAVADAMLAERAK